MITNNRTDSEPFVFPQQFGARGDGKTDDTEALEAAVRQASESGRTLKLPKGEYYLGRTLVLDRVRVLSEDAKISFWGMERNVPAIDMREDVSIYGRLHVWSVDNRIANHGGRCGMGFGHYGSGTGAHHCYVEELTVTGGVPNCNGILITGDSSDITLGKVIIPGGENFGRGILVHWGNSDQYKPKNPGNRAEGIFPIDGAGPTRHPHDIHIGTLICNHVDGDSKYPDSSAFYISAAYDVTVDEILADDVRMVIFVVGGDCGLEYAPEAVRKHGMKNLLFKKVRATNVHACAILYSTYSDYLGNTDFNGTLELGDVQIEGAEGNSGSSLACFGVKELNVGTLTLKKRNQQCVYLASGSENCKIGLLSMQGCAAQAVRTGRKEARDSGCENIRIDEIRVSEDCGGAAKELLDLEAVTGLDVGKIDLDGKPYENLLSVKRECGDVRIHEMVSRVEKR